MGGVVIGSTMELLSKNQQGRYAMGGLVIGSTMKLVDQNQRWLAPVINTGCNLDCPFCYLGDKKQKENSTMTERVAEKIAAMARQMDGVAIIGTEPLLDEEAVKIISIFTAAARTHILTNGVNLKKFADKIAAVRRIDISLDGGPQTYSRCRSFDLIREGAHKWHDISQGEICAMHVIHQENIDHIDDMLEGSKLLEAKKTFFSPFVRTLGGRTGVAPVSVREIAKALLPFSRDDGWQLMVDPYHAIFEWREWDKIKDDMAVLPDKNRLIIDFDPGDRVRRFEIDGQEHYPFMALHPGIKLAGK